MLLWLPRRCENAEWIAVEAETLIRERRLVLEPSYPRSRSPSLRSIMAVAALIEDGPGSLSSVAKCNPRRH